jgi:hypothetical protein
LLSKKKVLEEVDFFPSSIVLVFGTSFFEILISRIQNNNMEFKFQLLSQIVS